MNTASKGQVNFNADKTDEAIATALEEIQELYGARDLVVVYCLSKQLFKYLHRYICRPNDAL